MQIIFSISQKNRIFKELKNELMNIQVELSGYDYYQMENSS